MHQISYISDISKRIIQEIESIKANKNLLKTTQDASTLQKSPSQYSLKDLELLKQVINEKKEKLYINRKNNRFQSRSEVPDIINISQKAEENQTNQIGNFTTSKAIENDQTSDNQLKLVANHHSIYPNNFKKPFHNEQIEQIQTKYGYQSNNQKDYQSPLNANLYKKSSSLPFQSEPSDFSPFNTSKDNCLYFNGNNIVQNSEYHPFKYSSNGKNSINIYQKSQVDFIINKIKSEKNAQKEFNNSEQNIEEKLNKHKPSQRPSLKNNQYLQQQLQFGTKKNQNEYNISFQQPKISPNSQKSSKCQRNSSINTQALDALLLQLKQKKCFSYGINNFIFIKKLGKGMHSEVYLVLDKQTGFLFAIKKLNKQNLIANQMEEQFSCEIKIQISCNHPNIIKLYYYFSDESYIYLVMEYAHGKQLSTLLQEREYNAFSEQESAFYLYQTSLALSYLHKNSIMHRDIKADNILVSEKTVKLADFGYSRKCDSQNIRNTFCGTLDYLSPEIINGQQYDFQVDIWAFGVLVYQLLQGVAPFYEESQSDTLNKIKEGKFVFEKNISKQAQAFVCSLLSLDQNQRLKVRDILKDQWLLQEMQLYENSQQINEEINNQILELYQ